MFGANDRKKCETLFRKYYSGRKFSRGLYLDAVRAHVRPGHRLLDAGCGHYLEFSREFSDSVQVVGIDLEPWLDTRNEASPYGVRGNLETLPFPDACFDMVISRSVIEHLEDPLSVFREFGRVLRPGGKAILVTPNKYDYISVAASLTPYKLHRSLVSRVLGVKEDDVFPTFYRANTMRSLRRQLSEAGLVEIRLEAINHYPAYLMFSPLLFRLGILYERLTNLPSLAQLRGTLLCVFEKPAQPAMAGAQ